MVPVVPMVWGVLRCWGLLLCGHQLWHCAAGGVDDVGKWVFQSNPLKSLFLICTKTAIYTEKYFSRQTCRAPFLRASRTSSPSTTGTLWVALPVWKITSQPYSELPTLRIALPCDQGGELARLELLLSELGCLPGGVCPARSVKAPKEPQRTRVPVSAMQCHH